MHSYPIGMIVTPMLGLHVMLTESSVTPINQNTHSVFNWHTEVVFG